MTKRILSLQSMRLVASLTVFQYHLWNNYLYVPFLHPGTDFFIVLVGMVAAITEARRIPQGNWGKYLGGRYLRLYVTFVPVFILYMISGRDPLSVGFVVKSFFLIPIADSLPLVGVTWMLSMFLVFYWLFSLTFVFRRESVLIPIFSFWILACLITEFMEIKFPFFQEGFDILFNLRNLEFVLGYLGGWLVRSQKISARLSGILFVIGLIGIVPAIWFLNTASYDSSLRVFLYGPFMALIATGLAGLEQQGGWPGLIKWITHPWLVWLGGTSYVLYLLHNMFLRIWDALIPITMVQVPIITIVGVVVAALGYQFWEKPVLDFLRRKWFATN
jgi:peptidoglycan/LPS O-acetylase OafA/YrhL